MAYFPSQIPSDTDYLINYVCNPVIKSLVKVLLRDSSPGFLKVFQTFSLDFSHPSIFYTRLIQFRLCGGSEAYPSCHWARGGVHSRRVARPSQSHTTLTPRNDLGSPINLTYMLLDGGRMQTQEGPGWD